MKREWAATHDANESIVVNLLRRWRYEKTNVRSGKVSKYADRGRPNHNAATARYGGAIVRVMDIERALQHLTHEERGLLIASDADDLSQSEVAQIANISHRAVAYKLPAARKRFAEVLERLDLL